MGNRMEPMTSHDPERPVKLITDTNNLRAQYLGNSWRCYLATIANY